MKRLLALLIGAGLGIATLPAVALNLGALAENFDLTRTTEYRNGDKPQGGSTCPPTGWTELALGTANGEICEDSSTQFDISTSGNDDEGDNLIAYQTCGTGDCEVIAQIPLASAWTGHSETFTSFGVGIREGVSASAWYFQAWVTSDGVPRCKGGTPGPDDYTSLSSGGATLPEYLAVGHDDETNELRCLQSSDGATWQTYGTYTRDLAEPALGYVWGTSHDTAATTTATLTGIDLNLSLSVFTPSGGGSAPTLVTPISNQSGTQGVAITTLSCSANFTGQTLPYTISGLHASTALSFDTATCALSGTPNANDVGTRAVTISAVNATGSTPSVFQLAIAAATGDIFTIAASDTNGRTFNCANASTGANGASWASIRTSGSGASPGPGDTIRFAGGEHGAIDLNNCEGADGNRLQIVNRITDSEPARFVDDSGNSSPTFIFQCDSCINVDIDGTGGYVGAPGTYCGEHETTHANEEHCGFHFETDGADPFSVGWIKLSGLSSKYSVQGALIDGSGGTGTGGIGIDCNDHDIKFAVHETWREDIDISHNVVRDIGATSGEGIYCGPNPETTNALQDLPLRRISIRYNTVSNTSREGINGKFWLDGPNYIEFNDVSDTGDGAPTNAGQGSGINCVMCDVNINGNTVKEAGYANIRCQNINLIPEEASQILAEVTDDEFDCEITNNMVINPGANIANGPGILVNENGAADIDVNANIENNTVVDNGGTGVGISYSSPGGVCTSRDNIVAGITTEISGCPSTNDRINVTILSQSFANPGADNYELTALSGACGQDPNGYPTTDYEGTARPQGAANDQGADESALCP